MKHEEVRKLRAEVQADYNGGKSVAEICEERGLPSGRVYSYLRGMKNGGQKRGRKRKVFSKSLSELASEYEGGMSGSALAEREGVSVATMLRYLRESGVLIKRRGPYTPSSSLPNSDRDMEIVELRGEGRSLSEIGEKFGLTRERVRQILLKEGIEPVGQGGWTVNLPLERLKEDLEGGATLSYLSEKYGISLGTVASFLKRHDLSVNRDARLSWDIEEAKKDYLAGMPLWDMAKKYNQSSYNGIVNALLARGFEPRGVGRKDVSTDEIVELKKEGLTYNEIAEKVGLSLGGVALRLKKAGMTSPRGEKKDVSTEELVELKKEGLSNREIAERVGMSASGVSARLVRARRARAKS